MGARMPTSRRQFVASLVGCALFTPAARARDAGAPPLLLAKVAADDVDPSGYLVSEKYDGVRALWDGRTLRFRSGRSVPAPSWFLARLPAQPLDGELWLARGQFDALSAIVRKAEPVDAEWRGVHYMVFELPAASGPFAERYAAIQDLVRAARWPALRAVEQSRVPDVQALKRLLADVHGAGGEGLMLHRVDALVATGRSDVLLKLKPLADSEAQVVAHIAGQGKYAGMLGALEVCTPAGRRFRIGTGFSDAQRRDPPPLGSMVTYTYRDLTASGLPRFASYLRMADAL